MHCVKVGFCRNVPEFCNATQLKIIIFTYYYLIHSFSTTLTEYRNFRDNLF